MDELYASLDATHRRNVRRCIKNMRYELAGMERFSDFVALHEASWNDRGETGVLQTPALQSFYRESAQAFADARELRLHCALLDDAVIGVILAYHYKSRGYAYLGGFDPALKKLSPGTACMAFAMEQAIREGITEWDLLRGEELYKFLWGATTRTNAIVRANWL